VRKDDKRLFDLLQAEFILKTGKKITQQELFSEIVGYVQSEKENFFSRTLNLPLSDEKIKKIKQLQSDWGVKTEEEEIDKILYEATA
jgi:hypothetical protein